MTLDEGVWGASPFVPEVLTRVEVIVATPCQFWHRVSLWFSVSAWGHCRAGTGPRPLTSCEGKLQFHSKHGPSACAVATVWA